MARLKGPGHPLYGKFLQHDPCSDILVPAAKDPLVIFNIDGKDTDVPFLFDKKNGLVAWDGSVHNPASPDLARGGWAAVQKTHEGKWLVARGPVPVWMPQTAVAAEHLGVLQVALRAANHPTMVGDCQAVINGWGDINRATGASRPQAGIWRQVKQEGLPFGDFLKIKAHTEADPNATDEEAHLFEINFEADRWANIAVTERETGHDKLEQYQKRYDNFQKILKGAAKVLAALPSPKEEYGKLKRIRGPLKVKRRPKRKPEVSVQFLGHGLRSLQLEEQPQRGELVEAGLGHNLLSAKRADGEGTVVLCTRCGRNASARLLKLREPCPGKLLGGNATKLRNFLSGIHPQPRDAAVALRPPKAFAEQIPSWWPRA
jgi:hypothetical protein